MMTVKRMPESQSGFTLVEVLLAAVVLAVSILGFASTIVDGCRSAALNRETDAAARAARDVLEEVRSFARAFGDEAVDEYDGARRDVPALLFREENRDCLFVSVRETDPGDPLSRLLDVRVDVRWVGRLGPRDVSMTTRILGG